MSFIYAIPFLEVKIMLFYEEMDSIMGKLTIVSDEIHLKAVWLEGQTGMDVTGFIHQTTPVIEKTIHWLEQYFAKQNPNIKELPIQFEGSKFQRMVWEELCKIPYGQVTTYKNIADIIAKKLHKQNMSAQAVGGAVGKNPISIIVPCHRVIGNNGKLVGYQGGIDKKIKLLEHENLKIRNGSIDKSIH